MAKLTPTELETALQTLPGWHLSEGKLIRDYTFPDFAAAMTFVNQVAALAESANHHPDIDIRYNQVRLALISHDTGGITKRDIRLATAINEKITT
ncbi:4a-hydroxytetrahydrobiopterin dehydratase [Granulicella aggregans]|uniref:Putative pterin-4-alpha-carbinolamine dehydratase n=1 Tax=Granulicella aggregans TaxID=474949 RepID=A0A7W7ZE45_9BACT|nr:4a-hydroxytetrahydrobiopterin dehydratase [Granulicella aggregans]MBB5057671.1 4a-hydroxytetrahydrobiopterin dehydratase [Granulicella aggregans]